MIRLQYEIRSEAKERQHRMWEEANARDRRLIKSLDERQQRKREWWIREVDRRGELMPSQMFCMVKDSCCGPNKPSSSYLDQPNPPAT